MPKGKWERYRIITETDVDAPVRITPRETGELRAWVSNEVRTALERARSTSREVAQAAFRFPRTADRVKIKVTPPRVYVARESTAAWAKFFSANQPQFGLMLRRVLEAVSGAQNIEPFNDSPEGVMGLLEQSLNNIRDGKVVIK